MEQYRILVIAKPEVIELYTDRDAAEFAEQSICEYIADESGMDKDELLENAEISYCTPGSEKYCRDLDDFDFIMTIKHFVDESPYIERLQDSTYDDAAVTISSDDGQKRTVSFLAFKDELNEACCLTAHAAHTWKKLNEMEDAYLDVLYARDRAAGGEDTRGDEYETVMDRMSQLGEETEVVYGKAWSSFENLMKSLMDAPEELQENLLGRALAYDTVKMHIVKDALMLYPPDGLEEVTDSSAYDYIMSTFMTIYTEDDEH